eukprot:scaffold52186_cov29-Tisochrysis_lutea.AAC.1
MQIDSAFHAAKQCFCGDRHARPPPSKETLHGAGALKPTGYPGALGLSTRCEPGRGDTVGRFCAPILLGHRLLPHPAEDRADYLIQNRCGHSAGARDPRGAVHA